MKAIAVLFGLLIEAMLLYAIYLIAY